ncbi:hypothetical protein WJX72_006396 [[Myrmecia] bisecta]|uniref:NACHT domain-containing protein n=1 Tax=[Myrmecia] bisecta TaxID=41462 RepID=A0AAW1R7M6_9CHLO
MSEADVRRDVHAVAQGQAVLQQRLPHCRFLLALDDIDSEQQLEALLPVKMTDLDRESCILLTSRDQQQLRRMTKLQEVKELEPENAELLFCKYAFHANSPGAGLQQEQSMFLDVACMLLGARPDTTVRIWTASGWAGNAGLSIVLQRSLVRVESGRLAMHDHLRDLARAIDAKAFNYSPYTDAISMPSHVQYTAGYSFEMRPIAQSIFDRWRVGTPLSPRKKYFIQAGRDVRVIDIESCLLTSLEVPASVKEISISVARRSPS